MVFGAVLSLCNLYTGLKIGWGIGMSLTAALLAYGFWQLLQLTGKTKGLTIYETNVSQTAASAAASIAAAGLIAPIPALTILTGQTMSWPVLVVWTTSVCMVGIVVSIGLRKQLIEVEDLPFPSGFATGKTMQEIYNHGRDAMVRLQLLGATAVVAAAIKFAEDFKFIAKIPIKLWFKAQPGGGLEKAGIAGFSPANFGVSLEPTLMMYGVGAIVGPRVGLSVLLGAVVSWGILAPHIFEAGWVPPGAADASWFGAGLNWLLWPGVAIMVAASLTSFAFSWKSILNAFRPSRKSDLPPSPSSVEVLPKKWFIAALVAVTAVSVILQTVLFDITPWVATLGVLLTFMLALVAARVSGEVNVTPVTAMGKVTQLTFAILAPAQPAANLMSANVTGGAAALCADMMHDLKTGKMLGADPRPQYIAQVCGVIAGALVGCFGYLILIPDPAKDLFTEQWPAPSVTAWMSVAQLFMNGLDALPPMALHAMTIGACVGIVLAVLERVLPERARVWVPSGASVGLAFLIAPGISIALFLGSMVAFITGKFVPDWSSRFLIIAASGIIAGESLSGIFFALIEVLGLKG
jgi:putative OPT family oligopeptide transporter